MSDAEPAKWLLYPCLITACHFRSDFPTLLGFVKSEELISILGVGNSALRCEFTCAKLYGLVSRGQVHKLIKRENN